MSGDIDRDANRDGWERDFFDDLYWGLYLRRDEADADAVAARLWKASGLSGSPRGRTVFEQGCGAGEVARAFARSGARVLGIDIAENLVSRARGGTEGAVFRVHDATDVVPLLDCRPYDLAYNFNSGIGYAGADATRRFLLRAEECLAQGSPFLVEIYNGDWLLENHSDRFEDVRVDARTGRRWRIVRESRIGFRPEDAREMPRMLQDWTLTALDGGDEVLRRATAVDLMTPRAFGAIAAAAGFNEPACLDSQTLEPATPASRRIIMRLTRRSRPARDGELAARARAAFEARRDAPVIQDGATLDGASCLSWVARCEAMLRTLPPRNGTRSVALLLPRSWAVPLSMVAARVAGYAFAPLDAEAPDARLAGILARLRPAAVVAFTDDTARVRTLLAEAGIEAEGAPVRIAPPADGLETVSVLPCRGPRALDRSPSHVVFTSGSSGRPKGVLLREGPLLATVDAQVALIGEAAGTPALWMLNPGFDASLSDIFCALLGDRPLRVHRTGATRVKALREALAHAGCVDLPPSLMHLVDPSATALRSCTFGGERAAPGEVLRWGSSVRALQAYGPTETSVCVAMARAGGAWRDGCIGRPLQPRTLWLREPDGTMRRIEAAHPGADVDDADAFNATVLVPAATGSVEGEILVSGLPVGNGYLDDPEAQARRFVEVGGRKMHRTGDVARWTDGILAWIGRDDRQVKLNGRLVCPEEVESAVGRLFPGVAACCLADADGLVLAVEGDAPSPDLARAVSDDLGGAFRPRRVERVEAFPRNANGKVDLAALSDIVSPERREAAGALAG